MNMIKRWTALLLTVLMLLSVALPLASCQEEPPVEPDGGTDDTVEPGQSVNYSVTVRSEGGIPLSGLTLYVYDGQNNIKAHADTSADGTAVFTLPAADDYTVELDRVPEGYIFQERYDMATSGATNIVLTSKVIEDTDLTGVTYKLGSIMKDFEVTLTDGTVWKLSEALKTKKAVMLNFWYTTCTYCIEEFPGLNSAYLEYQDQVDVIALNAYSGDTFDEVKLFQSTYYDYALSLPMAKDVGIQNAFGFTANPVSVMIDRYGMVTLIHIGAITERQFARMFEIYSADDYKPMLSENVEQLVPQLKPDVDMPSTEELSAVLNKGDITVTYTPETEQSDAEYSWPFLIDKKEGVDCIYPANTGVDSSFATLHAKVELKAGEAIVFDYLSSTANILYVLVDGDDIYQISGVDDKGWQQCCPWVATEDGVYDVAFVYTRGTEEPAGDDRVYLSNFQVIAAKDVTAASYIPREAATKPTEDASDYQSYATVVYSEVDGYYHVGTADGPILLARLIYNTRFSDVSVSANLQENHGAGSAGFLVDGVDRYAELLQYCNYAANSQIYTYCSVTKELRSYLEAYVEFYGFEVHENTWLQLCSYYDVYGQDENGNPTPQLADPIKGLSTHSAYIAEEGKANRVEYNGQSMIPRGYLYKFTPTTSGAYRITSANTDQELIGWIFIGDDADWIANGDRILLIESDVGERICYELMYEDEEGNVKYDSYNVSMVAYLEAGKDYYIDIAFGDVVGMGSFTFEITRLGDTYDYFVMASPGPFTYELSPDGSMGDTIAGGIDVVLGEDGYYYHKKEDGTIGSMLYADFYMTTSIFTGESLQYMVDKGAFDFTLSELDHEAVYIWESVGKSEDALKEKWGDDFDSNWELYQMEDIIVGKYHGIGEDMTEVARAYISQMIVDAAHPEIEGCVPVSADLAELLQLLMDKYTFPGVENSWTKLCFYYEYLGR